MNKTLAAEALAWVELGSKANAIVIGEEITDEYIYVHPLFKSGKDNIVAFSPGNREVWNGGASIVEQDLAEFAHSVRRIKNGPPVIKRRYVDEAFKQKLFSLVEVPAVKPIGNDWGYHIDDLIVVADYGHGLISPQDANAIGARAAGGFLAMTVQSNSANWGFNLLTKWARADYVVLDQNELRLACHDQHGDIEKLAWQQHERMATRIFAVTLGHEGCLVLNGDDMVRAPAVAQRVIDRMGAGDAFLAVTAPLAWAGAPAKVVALVGNIAGAIKVGKVGNQPVTRREVEQWLNGLCS